MKPWRVNPWIIVPHKCVLTLNLIVFPGLPLTIILHYSLQIVTHPPSGICLSLFTFYTFCCVDLFVCRNTCSLWTHWLQFFHTLSGTFHALMFPCKYPLLCIDQQICWSSSNGYTGSRERLDSHERMAECHVSLPKAFASGDANEWFKCFDICCKANGWNGQHLPLSCQPCWKEKPLLSGWSSASSNKEITQQWRKRFAQQWCLWSLSHSMDFTNASYDLEKQYQYLCTS